MKRDAVLPHPCEIGGYYRGSDVQVERHVAAPDKRSSRDPIDAVGEDRDGHLELVCVHREGDGGICRAEVLAEPNLRLRIDQAHALRSPVVADLLRYSAHQLLQSGGPIHQLRAEASIVHAERRPGLSRKRARCDGALVATREERRQLQRCEVGARREVPRKEHGHVLVAGPVADRVESAKEWTQPVGVRTLRHRARGRGA